MWFLGSCMYLGFTPHAWVQSEPALWFLGSCLYLGFTLHARVQTEPAWGVSCLSQKRSFSLSFWDNQTQTWGWVIFNGSWLKINSFMHIVLFVRVWFGLIQILMIPLHEIPRELHELRRIFELTLLTGGRPYIISKQPSNKKRTSAGWILKSK